MKKLFKNRKSVYFIGAILCCISSVFILFSLDKDKWKWIKGKVILPKKGARENEILRREAARRNRLKLELAACEKGDYKDEAHKWVWGWLKERVENYYRYSGRISIHWKVEYALKEDGTVEKLEKEIANEYNLTLLNNIDEARKKYKKGLKWVREELTPEKGFISKTKGGLVKMYKNPDPSFFIPSMKLTRRRNSKLMNMRK